MSLFDSVFRPLSFEDSPGDDVQTPKPLTDKFRNRVLQLCDETFPDGRVRSPSFWEEMHRKFRYQKGVTQLTRRAPRSKKEDLIYFLNECDDTDFLRFIEWVCEIDDLRRITDQDNFVDAINKFFRVDDLPYALTEFQWEETESLGAGTSYALVETPKVIRRDNQVTHESAVEPALRLLEEKQFSSANSEFLEAMEDFRHGDYRDCLTKACSAMESTMKIICDRRGWKYSEEDSAGTLVETVVSNSSLEGYFQQLLMIVATLRNRLSASHGAGTKEKQVPEHLARYTINATASNILLLVEECA